MAKNKHGWDRDLGTSKRQQGVITPKRKKNRYHALAAESAVLGGDTNEGQI